MPKGSVLDTDDLLRIQIDGAILTFEEVLDLMLIDIDDLGEDEMKIAKRIHKSGKIKATVEAYETLSKSKKNDSALAILNKISTTFQQTPETMPSGDDFNFNIFMQDNRKDENLPDSDDSQDSK